MAVPSTDTSDSMAFEISSVGIFLIVNYTFFCESSFWASLRAYDLVILDVVMMSPGEPFLIDPYCLFLSFYTAKSSFFTLPLNTVFSSLIFMQSLFVVAYPESR
jgi:hypothetical protein